MGVFQTTYEQTILSQYSTSTITWIFSTQLALMWLPGPLYGRLIDTFGPAPVLYPCAALAVFGLGMTSLADEYYQIFLAQGIAFGIGSGGVFTTALVCAAQWFSRRRGLAVGIASVGSSVGGVVFPAFFVRLSPRVGFHAAVRWAALVVGVLLAAACLLVRARLPPRRWDPSQRWLDLTMLRQRQFGLYTLGCFFVMWVRLRSPSHVNLRPRRSALELTGGDLGSRARRWGIWGPFDFVSSMAENAGFPHTLALYLISIVKYVSAVQPLSYGGLARPIGMASQKCPETPGPPGS